MIFRSRNNRKLLLQTALILLSLIFAAGQFSCYPGDPISASDTDVVTTFRDPNADFSTKQSYAMPDSLIFISESGPTSSGDRQLDDQVLSAIDRNMQQAGYGKVANPGQADVLVVPMATSTTFVGGACYPWYWGWYYPYPGWCYPVAYSYTTGTILINMMDASRSGSNVEVDALWIAGINGLLEGSSATAAGRINRDVDQAFKQSPYLSEGK